MTTLLEIKERIRGFCSKYEVYLVPVIKSILAFLTFMTIRSQMGYMTRLNSMTVMLVLACFVVFSVVAEKRILCGTDTAGICFSSALYDADYHRTHGR